MAKLSWGEPIVQLKKEGTSIWITVPEIKQDTAQLTVEKGDKKEALNEGGQQVDVKYLKNKPSFEWENFIKKGESKPIEDADGLIIDNYAVRLIPEDPANEGFIIDRVSLSAEDTWSSADGKLVKYTAEGLKPISGNIVKPFFAPIGDVDNLAWDSAAADSTGKTVTIANTTATITAATTSNWVTLTVAENVVTAKVTANTGAARSGVVTITTDGYSFNIAVSQVAASNAGN